MKSYWRRCREVPHASVGSQGRKWLFQPKTKQPETAESCAQENFFGQNTNCTGHVACEHGQVAVARGQRGEIRHTPHDIRALRGRVSRVHTRHKPPVTLAAGTTAEAEYVFSRCVGFFSVWSFEDVEDFHFLQGSGCAGFLWFYEVQVIAVVSVFFLVFDGICGDDMPHRSLIATTPRHSNTSALQGLALCSQGTLATRTRWRLSVNNHSTPVFHEGGCG